MRQHGGQRPCIPRAQELEVARRNLEPRHVAMSPHAEHLALEHRERASRVTSSLIAAPEPPGRMQDIEVRLLNAPPKAMKQIPHVEQRCVERLAVEAHQGACLEKLSGKKLQRA